MYVLVLKLNLWKHGIGFEIDFSTYFAMQEQAFTC